VKIQYVGPHDGVEVPLPDGAVIDFEIGGSQEVPAEVGRQLLEQAQNWAPGDAAAKRALAELRKAAGEQPAEAPAEAPEAPAGEEG
jgi:hypothetical protein